MPGARELFHAINGSRSGVAPQFPRPVRAVVQKVDDDGISVTIPGHGDYLYGPASWQPIPGAGDPPKGTRCVVMFDDDGIAEPVVISFVRWPPKDRPAARTEPAGDPEHSHVIPS